MSLTLAWLARSTILFIAVSRRGAIGANLLYKNDESNIKPHLRQAGNVPFLRASGSNELHQGPWLPPLALSCFVCSKSRSTMDRNTQWRKPTLPSFPQRWYSTPETSLPGCPVGLDGMHRKNQKLLHLGALLPSLHLELNKLLVHIPMG